MTRSGTCVAVGGRGVLLQGPSGAGKSDLALRLIDGGAELVADDRVVLEARAGVLSASAPTALRGLLEVRGLGVFRLPYRISVAVALVAELGGERDDRLPLPNTTTVLGHELPAIRLSGERASAAARVRLALGTAVPVAGVMGDAA
ncbi:MAG: HPr kinase/phosphatase C-terminal domain-containing protein [Alphaproteobacteria bacterium]|nr:HPr kinase/phosphatase C-terminal domain-containing protein [Alphaproteobacteria bacterium]